MTEDEARKLPLGLYRIHWYSGGTSLAAVGQGHDGRRWLAPINWLAPAQLPDWSAVVRVEAVPLEREPGEAARLEAEVQRLTWEQTAYAEHVSTSLTLDMQPMRWGEWMEQIRAARARLDRT